MHTLKMVLLHNLISRLPPNFSSTFGILLTLFTVLYQYIYTGIGNAFQHIRDKVDTLISLELYQPPNQGGALLSLFFSASWLTIVKVQSEEGRSLSFTKSAALFWPSFFFSFLLFLKISIHNLHYPVSFPASFSPLIPRCSGVSTQNHSDTRTHKPGFLKAGTCRLQLIRKSIKLLHPSV